MKKVELLAPAGTLEKLKIAIKYGADSIYIGNNLYSLRKSKIDFNYEKIKIAISIAKKKNVKIYVALNIIMKEDYFKKIYKFLKFLYNIKIFAIIISDPSLIIICKKIVPKLKIHLSTQMSIINIATIKFWEKIGINRIILARELSFNEIKEIKKNTKIEIEIFIHGSMCISYSGKCMLSNYMFNRNANNGDCAQPCRNKYYLYNKEIKFCDNTKEFCLSAVDLCMLKKIKNYINIGIDSFKIEGRLKSIHYISTVVNVYRKIIDCCYIFKKLNKKLINKCLIELKKVSNKGLSLGFYNGMTSYKDIFFNIKNQKTKNIFIGEILEYNSNNKIAVIKQRNKFFVGDKIEIYGPKFIYFYEKIVKMWNRFNEIIYSSNQQMTIVKILIFNKVFPGYMIRKINN